MCGLLWTDASNTGDKLWSVVSDIMSLWNPCVNMSYFKLKLSLEQVLSHWTNMPGAVRASVSSQKTKKNFDKEACGAGLYKCNKHKAKKTSPGENVLG